jgi:uncharacterized membrane protein YkvI
VQILVTLTLLAAQSSVWDQVQRVPRQFWINAIICVLAVLMVARLWREMKRLNDYAPYIVAVIVTLTVFFYWVYNRTEPRILSPLVDRLMPFFPTKSKHEQDLEKLRRAREN